jgi:hypothetical protein
MIHLDTLNGCLTFNAEIIGVAFWLSFGEENLPIDL